MNNYKLTFLLIAPFLASIFWATQLNAQQTKYQSAVVIYRQKVTLRPYQGTVLRYDTLKYNRTKSIFQWNLFQTMQYIFARAEKRHPELKSKIEANKQRMKGKNFNGPQTNLVNIDKDSIYSLRYLRAFNEWIYYKQKRPEIHWQFKDSTKKIGNYTVKKATAHFHGRDYTAWYTPKIPVPYGPWKLGGLPGLILQVYDQSGNFYFSATKIIFKPIPSVGPIHLTGKEKHISYASYKKIVSHPKRFIKRKRVKILRMAVSNGAISQKAMNERMRELKIPNIRPLEIFPDSSEH